MCPSACAEERGKLEERGKKIACPHCPDTFSKLYNLKRHIDRVHVSINKTTSDICPGLHLPELPIQMPSHHRLKKAPY